MPRPREFDESAVVDRATEVFRAHGYESTSITDLEDALGMGRQSLYNVFGDKRGLFLRVLERYAESNMERVRSLLQVEPGGLDGIRRYLRGLVAFLADDPARNGCLVARSLVDDAHADPAIAQRCGASQTAIKRELKSALQVAKARGELADGVSIDTAATMLSGHVLGLTGLLRADTSKSAMRKSGELLVDLLEKR